MQASQEVGSKRISGFLFLKNDSSLKSSDSADFLGGLLGGLQNCNFAGIRGPACVWQ
jgi:hypothetical protein